MKYKQGVVKFSFKYGVKNTSIKFNTCEITIYRWRKKYDGSIESLADKSRKPHTTKESGKVERSHRKEQERFYYDKIFYSLEDLRNRVRYWIQEYNNFSMKPLGWLSPNEKLAEYMNS